MSAPETRSNPFPGLRPFREDEEHLFFGRENQVDTTIEILARRRFLAVVGTSGSGKSSLVNCGLRPALRRGLMEDAGSAWSMVQFRPAGNPIRAMARAIAEQRLLFGLDPSADESSTDIVEGHLRVSKRGLVDVYDQASAAKSANLLVVVDQFEELFRFRHAGGDDTVRTEEAVAFISLLLEPQSHLDRRIYVVLTMRSDFLGDCAELPGLAETISPAQYLVPRMKRDDRRAAIVGPIHVGGASISPVLLTRLLNDVGDTPDQLSILQHALNRTWARWETEREGPLSLQHYEAIGTMAAALDRHAEEAYEQLSSDRQRVICERVFKALTDTASDARGIRRPTRFSTLCAITDGTAAEVRDVLEVFRVPSRSFLMPPVPEALDGDAVIDISHESLMRVWARLQGWADEEAKSRAIYLRIADSAQRYTRGEAGLVRDPELQFALDWWSRVQPNEAWAARYHDGFIGTLAYLRESADVRDAARHWAAPVAGASGSWGPLADRYLTHRPRKLLAIDGGWLVGGRLSIEVLARIQQILREKLGRPELVLADYFDYIGGTGVGGTIATLLAHGADVSAIVRLYARISELKSPPLLQRALLRFLYDSKPVANALREFLGESADLAPDHLRCLLMVLVRDAANGVPWPISSNPLARYNDRARADCNLRIPQWQLARASLAAPPMFGPEVIDFKGGVKPNPIVLEDGTMTPYTNPAFLLYRMATQAPYRLGWLSGERNLLVISVGSGREAQRSKDDPTKRNMLQQISRLTITGATRLEQDMICRTVGRCLWGSELDREQGDLIPRYQMSGAPIPLAQDLGRAFLYARYDVELSVPELEHLGVFGVAPEEFRSDSRETLESMGKIGQALAAQVAPEHFGPFLDSDPPA